MPRANRCLSPGFIWHLTHRCHNKSMLFNAASTRDRYRYWLHQAVTRYGLCVLNYTITQNHIHILTYVDEESIVPDSIQLTAGRTAQEYNASHDRRGAFWEDRYHATAVADGHHFLECITYIDLNMVRTGIIDNPAAWKHSGLYDAVHPRDRYKIVDNAALLRFTGFDSVDELTEYRIETAETKIADGSNVQMDCWTKSIGVGDNTFIEALKIKLGKNGNRTSISSVPGNTDMLEIREPIITLEPENNPEKTVLSPQISLFWDLTHS